MKTSAVVGSMLGLLLCGGQPGCSSKACTLIGCGPAFQVTYQVAGGQSAWSPGVYNVTVTADGSTTSCDVTLPLGDCQTSSLQCTGNPDWSFDYGGCALPPEQHRIYGVTFWAAMPANVEIVFSRDGVPLGEGTFTPTYRSSQPNGPECDPTCHGAPEATMPIQL